MNDQTTDARLVTSPVHYFASESHLLGEWLVMRGAISQQQADEIARVSAERGLRFGEVAVELGHVSEDDINRALAAQFDVAPQDPAPVDASLIMITDPHSQGAEDIRSLRNALVLRWFKHPEGARTLSVISAGSGDGRSTIAANLAIACAQVGFDTLLIDADMRAPSQHTLFHVEDRFGLAGFLAGRPSDAINHEIPGFPKLTVITVGGTPPNPQELLMRGMFQTLIREAKQRFEVIIVDTPAASVATDYQLIAAETQGAMLVTSRNQTRVQEARELVAACRSFGIRLVGSTMATTS